MGFRGGSIRRYSPLFSYRISVLNFENRKEPKLKTTDSEKLCQYCGFRGHLQEDCRLKSSAQKRLRNEERVAIADEHAFTAGSSVSGNNKQTLVKVLDC